VYKAPAKPQHFRHDRRLRDFELKEMTVDIAIALTSLIPDVSTIGPNYIVRSAVKETGCLTVYRRYRKFAGKLAKCCLEVGIGTFFLSL